MHELIVIQKIPLHVENRDGKLFAVEAQNGRFYLVLEADTLHNREVFHGMGSTDHIEISTDAFFALALYFR